MAHSSSFNTTQNMLNNTQDFEDINNNPLGKSKFDTTLKRKKNDIGKKNNKKDKLNKQINCRDNSKSKAKK